jgi:sec-independent protein translocase protein TatB
VFDVGFWELTLIATLALLVLGPDKLPGVVNGVGRMLGRARSLARGLKMQIEREMNQTATMTPKPKGRPGAASGEKSAERSPPHRDGTASSTGDKPRQDPEPTADDPHGESRTAE